jgi:hypothetical protein
VKRYLEVYEVAILHYCLMPNHVHLLVQVEKAAHLPKFMQGILQVYAHHFKKQYEEVGFVFQNRYKSNLIENDSYLLECGRYIERNPLRAMLTEDLFTYPWSSFSFYAKGIDDGIIKIANPLYETFNPSAGFPEFQAGDERNLASGGNPRISNSVVREIVTEKKGASSWGSTSSKRESYIAYICQERAYELIVDQEFRV